MKKLSITLGIFGLVSGLVGVLGNTVSYATEPPDFSAVAQGANSLTGVAAAVAVERRSKIVVGSGTLQIVAPPPIGANTFILNVTDATLSTDKEKNVKGQEPIPVTNSFFPGLITCSPAYAQLTVEVSPGVTTTIQLNECEEDNPTNPIFMKDGVLINPCTGNKVTDTEAFKGVCLSGGHDTIVISEFTIGSTTFCSGNCIALDDVVISELKLPVCTLDLATGKITCFGIKGD